MGKIRILITNIAKKDVVFRRIIRSTLRIVKHIRYKLRSIGCKTNDKMVLFCTFNGKAYADSPKAIYEYMLNSSKYDDYKFIWIFKEPEEYKFLEKNKNTIITKKNTRKYEKYFIKSKYWIMNFKIPDYITPKKNQVFIQCWHGTPLKRLGYDLVNFDNLLNTKKEMGKRYKLEAKKMSYFLSPSRYATEKFISAWNLKEFNKEDIIIEEGYPRNDFLFNYKEEDVINIKKKILGNDTNNYEGKKIILYAPTYRANQHKSGVGYVYKEEVDFEKLKEKLGDEYIILFRPHYFIANVFDFEKYKGFVYNVANIDDINELYIISDILITDYSSVFFDYANLKRPIIFYMYDLEHYRDKSNGFYFDIEKTLPGKIIKTDDELIDEVIKASKEFTYDDKYKKFNNMFNYLDDGNASKRVIEKIIK